MTTQSHENVTAANIDVANDSYAEFRKKTAEAFSNLDPLEPLFNVQCPYLFDHFLEALPEHMRQHYNCNTCRTFIERYGRMVVVDASGVATSAIWTFDVKGTFEAVVDALGAAVRDKKIVGRTVIPELNLGHPHWGGFDHCYGTVSSSVMMANTRTVKNDIQAGVSYLRNHLFGDMYTPAMFQNIARFFRGDAGRPFDRNYADTCDILAHIAIKVHPRSNKRLVSGVERNNFLWRVVCDLSSTALHFHKGVIGSVAEAIMEGHSERSIVKMLRETVMNDNTFRKSSALPTEGNMMVAESIIKELGVQKSFLRRYAFRDEVPMLWTPPFIEVTKQDEIEKDAADFFDGIKTKDGSKHRTRAIQQASKLRTDLGKQSIRWTKFKDIIEKAESVHLLVPVTASIAAYHDMVHPDSAPVLFWDKPDARCTMNWMRLNTDQSYSMRWSMKSGDLIPVHGISAAPMVWDTVKTIHDFRQEDIIFFHVDGFPDFVNSCCNFAWCLREELRPIEKVIAQYDENHQMEVPENNDRPVAVAMAFTDTNESLTFQVVVDGEEQWYELTTID